MLGSHLLHTQMFTPTHPYPHSLSHLASLCTKPRPKALFILILILYLIWQAYAPTKAMNSPDKTWHDKALLFLILVHFLTHLKTLKVHKCRGKLNGTNPTRIWEKKSYIYIYKSYFVSSKKICCLMSVPSNIF